MAVRRNDEKRAPKGARFFVRGVGALSFGLSLGLSSGARADAPRARVFPLEALARSGPTLASGQRIERGSEGEWFVSESLLPEGRDARFVALPEHLGGGYLFHESVAHGAGPNVALYRSQSFTGPLEPLGLVPGSYDRVEAGFDRVYLRGSSGTLGFDLERQRVVGLEPLPPVVTIDQVAFDDAGLVALEAPLVGVIASVDGGRSFFSTKDVTRLEAGEGIVGFFERDRKRMTRDGSFLDAAPVFRERSAERFDEADFVESVLRGARTDSGAIALVRGEIVELDESNGLRVTKRPTDVERGVCSALPGPGLFFHCTGPADGVGAADETSRLVEIADGRVVVRQRVVGARAVLARGPGVVLLEGDCRNGRRGACRLGRAAAESFVAASRASARGVDGAGVVELAFGRAGLELVRSPSIATRADSKGAAAQRRVYPFPTEVEHARLLREGQFLRELVRVEDGWIGWVVRGEEFAGVLFSDDGQLNFGPLQKPVRRATFSGRHAISWGASGFAKETTDGGLTWHDVRLPFRHGDPDLDVPRSPERPVRVGCGPAGCVLGPFVRLGFGGGSGSDVEAPLPARVTIPPPGGGRHRFRCGRAPGSPERVAGGRADHFWNTPLPEAGPHGVRVQAAALEELGVFVATGPGDSRFAEEGRARIFFRDPFSFDPVRTTRPTAGLFEDGVAAERALGLLEAGTTTTQIVLAADGRGGLLLSSGSGHADLFTFTEAGVIERKEGADALGLRRLHGAVRSRGVWYTAEKARDRFVVLRLGDDGIEEFASFPLGSASSRTIDLVGSANGDLGIAMDGDAGLFVYPLGRDGALGEPVLVPHRGARPKTCELDAPGYLVVRELAIAPFVEGASGPLDVSRVVGRYRVAPDFVCLEALAARSRTPIDAGSFTPTSAAVSLVVADFEGVRSVSRLLCE